MNKDAYYFPHFSNARQDRKLKRAMKQLGIEGYAIYFMLLEVLRDQTDLCYPMEDIDLLADEFGTSEQKVRAIICNYQLFDVDDEDQFFSPKFNEYLAPYLEQKEVNRINGIKGNLIRHGKASKDEIAKMTNEQILALNSKESRFLGGDSGGDRVAVAKKEKKSKVNQSKVKESNIYTFDSFWDAYDKKIDRKKCEAKWNRLPVKDKEAILEFIPIYQAHQPDEKYRKNPYTFLNSEIWTEDWNNYQPKSENNDSSNDFYQQLSELERINEVQRHNDQEGASPVNIYQLRGR
jgi:hypothetical protein